MSRRTRSTVERAEETERTKIDIETETEPNSTDAIEREEKSVTKRHIWREESWQGHERGEIVIGEPIGLKMDETRATASEFDWERDGSCKATSSASEQREQDVGKRMKMTTLQDYTQVRYVV